MHSNVYMYAAFFARKPLFSIVTIGLTVFLLIWTFVNTNKLRASLVDPEQLALDYIANNIDVKVTAGDTVPTARDLYVTLWNRGPEVILYGQWRIYFYMFGTLSSEETAGLKLQWVNGGLHYISPIKGSFGQIPPGSKRVLIIKGYKSASRTNHFPNWYVASNAFGFTSARIIESTKSESLSFVSNFDTPVQWKRHEFDQYNPYTPSQRHSMYQKYHSSKVITYSESLGIIPTPLSIKKNSENTIMFDATWVIIKTQESETNDVPSSRFLARKLGLTEVSLPPKSGNYIAFKTNKAFGKEQYEVSVSAERNTVLIISNDDAGAFYGAQTLISIIDTSLTIPEVTIYDRPRFAYRGFMVDVSRNFHTKATLKTLIDIMAMYKMNKLHLHLTDDEGWRIEIPRIPELTKYGSRRCNYYEEEKCLIPSLGSGPFPSSSGSGFYTVSDFREILRYAKERHVHIIPEIDVPGHALSAIQAMLFREQDLEIEKDKGKHPSYVLSDDVSGIPSVQQWVGNSINPCLNATYRFLDSVLADLQMIYEGIQKLDLVHIGGDEVPNGVWANSDACQAVFRGKSPDHTTLKKMFLLTIADIAHRRGLNLSAWEDGLYNKGVGPYSIKDFKQKQVYVNAWNNIWEAGKGGRAIEFSDNGYKVILSMATHLYFDHPYEPDPEERGLYWATRYTDTYKVFGFMPMDIFANAEYDSSGNKIDLNQICGGPCPKIKFRENIVGMEACAWSETIRTGEELFDMTFPRLLAFAERAWHAAKWENTSDPLIRNAVKRSAFKRFIDNLGKKELPRIERAGGNYRVPPPGVALSRDSKIVKINTFYPDHETMLSFGNDSGWRKVDKTVEIPPGVKEIKIYALSSVLKRKSRTIAVTITNDAYSFNYLCNYKHVVLLWLILLYN